MLKVGLTGGIGCGKTTVGKLFAGLSVPVIDADDITRELVQKGRPALSEIQTVFGDSILNIGGALDRNKLRELVFSDPMLKNRLETILHPRVFQSIQDQCGELDAPYCIITVPLLFETKHTDIVDRILVADCPSDIQIARVKQRDRLTDARIASIIQNQVSREYRLKHADDIIDTTLTSGELAENLKKLHNFYLYISASQDTTACEKSRHL